MSISGFEKIIAAPIEKVVEDAINNAHPHADEFLWMRFIYCDESCAALQVFFEPLITKFNQTQTLPSPRHYFVLGNYFQFVKLKNMEAFKCYEKALPDVGALNNLGYMYLDGFHVKQNGKTAVEFFLKAIEAGSIMSLVNLAIYYFDSKNIPEAMFYIQKAMLKDSAHAFHTFGDIHFRGGIIDGYNQTYHRIEGIKYFKMAAEKGSLPSLLRLADVYMKGYATHKQDLDLAAQFYEMCLICVTNKYSRNQIFSQLCGIYKEVAKIKNWISAERFFLTNFQNTPMAPLPLAKMYAVGDKGVKKNIEKAAELFYLSLRRGLESGSTWETLLILFGEHPDNPVVIFYYVLGTLQPHANKDPGHVKFNAMVLEKKHTDAFAELFEANPKAAEYLTDKNYKKVSQKINERIVKRYKLIQKEIKEGPAKIVNDYLMGDRSFRYLAKPFFLPPRKKPSQEAKNPDPVLSFFRRFKVFS